MKKKKYVIRISAKDADEILGAFYVSGDEGYGFCVDDILWKRLNEIADKKKTIIVPSVKDKKIKKKIQARCKKCKYYNKLEAKCNW